MGDSHLMAHNKVPGCYQDIVKGRKEEGNRLGEVPDLGWLKSGRKFWDSWVDAAIRQIKRTKEPTIFVLCCGTNNLRETATLEGVAAISGFHARFIDAILETPKTALCIVSPIPDSKKFTDALGDKLDKVLKTICLGRQVYKKEEEKNEGEIFEEVRKGNGDWQRRRRISTHQKGEEGTRFEEEERVFTRQSSEEGIRTEEEELKFRERIHYVRFRTKKLPHGQTPSHYRPQFFKDAVHVNEEGARMLAREIFNSQVNIPNRVFGWDAKPVTNPTKVINVIESKYLGLTKEQFDVRLEKLLKDKRKEATRFQRKHNLGAGAKFHRKNSF